jgi:hypothetical protein
MKKMVSWKAIIIPAICTGVIAGAGILLSKGFPIDWASAGVSAGLTLLITIATELKKIYPSAGSQSVGKKKTKSEGIKLFVGQK